MKLKHLENIDKKCCETNCKECPLNHNLYKEGTCERDFADFLCNYVSHRNMTTKELIETYTNVEMPSKWKYTMSCTAKWLSSDETTTKIIKFKSLDSYSIKWRLSGVKLWECINFKIWETDTGKIICEGKNYEDFVKKMGEKK